jgi:hypothetical protein
VFFVLRTNGHSRVGKGEKLDHNTLRLIITIRTSTKGFGISSPPKRSRTMSRTMSRCFRVWPFEKTETIFGRPHRRKFRLADHGGEVMKRAREVVSGTQLVPERAGWTPEAIAVVSKTVGGKREFMKPRDGAKEVLRARCGGTAEILSRALNPPDKIPPTPPPTPYSCWHPRPSSTLAPCG